MICTVLLNKNNNISKEGRINQEVKQNNKSQNLYLTALVPLQQPIYSTYFDVHSSYIYINIITHV